MAQCRLLYRRDAAGPVTYLVECEGRKRFLTHGQLGAFLSDDRIGEIIGGRGGRWIEVSGDIEIALPNFGPAIVPPPVDAQDMTASV